MFHTDLHLFARVAIGCVVAFVFGFECHLRGSPAGDRTFILIGGAATAVTAVAGLASPQAVAGILTGLGFIGVGLVFTAGNKVRGLTSAASVFAVAGIGLVIGFKPRLPRSLPGRPVAVRPRDRAHTRRPLPRCPHVRRPLRQRQGPGNCARAREPRTTPAGRGRRPAERLNQRRMPEPTTNA